MSGVTALYESTPSSLKLKAGVFGASSAVTHSARAQTVHDMNSLVSLLVLTCACASGEPLAAALQRRSDARGQYAQQFARYQRPPAAAAAPAGAAFAALSLHAPFPVLHVLSRVPLQQPDDAGAYSSLRPTYAHPTYAHPTYAHPTYAHPFPYAAPSTNQYTYDINSESEEPTILYARPNPRGGYSYRRRHPARRRATPAPARPAEPLIIRVHKYRVIRDR